jgi:hypothetical protein
MIAQLRDAYSQNLLVTQQVDSKLKDAKLRQRTLKAAAKKIPDGSLEKLKAEWLVEDQQKQITRLEAELKSANAELKKRMRAMEQFIANPISPGSDEKPRTHDRKLGSRSAAFGKWKTDD